MKRAWIAAAVVLAACPSNREEPGESDERAPAPPAVSEDECARAGLPASFSLAGLDAASRLALLEHAGAGLVAVRLTRTGCKTELSPIAECRLPNRYRPVLRGTAISRSLATPVDVAASVPLATATALAPSGAPFQMEGVIASTLEIEPGTGVRKKDLSQPACAGATHVITSLHVGQVLVSSSAGTAVASAGEPGSCRRGDPGQFRPRGCSEPILAELLSVEENGKARLSDAPMVDVPAGAFVFGDGRDMELQAFQIDRTEVTAADYEQCVASGNCTAGGEGPDCTGGVLGLGEHPINCIDWTQAESYCAFVEKRLPTEAEWERAARGTDGSPYAWGDEWPPPPGAGNFADQSARLVHAYWRTIEGYDDGFARTAPASAFASRPAPSGAIQMTGNVGEWTSDAVKGGARIVRGIGFGRAGPEDLRASQRDWYLPDTKSRYFGVRCAR